MDSNSSKSPIFAILTLGPVGMFFWARQQARRPRAGPMHAWDWRGGAGAYHNGRGGVLNGRNHSFGLTMHVKKLFFKICTFRARSGAPRGAPGGGDTPFLAPASGRPERMRL